MKRFTSVNSMMNIGIIAVIVMCLSSMAQAQIPHIAPGTAINIEPVTQLIDLIETLIIQNPKYPQMSVTLTGMDKAARDSVIDSLITGNAASPAISQKIEALLNSRAYELYYRQFRNMTPKQHRRILHALPYTAIRSPADVAQHLLEMVTHVDSLKRWINKVVASVNLDRSRQIARKWLPPGDYTLPPIHFIFDGNGDAFAREGEIVFDLYGVIFSGRSADTRFTNLAAIGTDEIEAVLAHELHHIFIYPQLRNSAPSADAPWRERWRWQIIRGMVTEGVAMHCNPPEGFKRMIQEDTAVVAYWIRELNEKHEMLQLDEAVEDDFWQWMAKTYQDGAGEVLAEYLGRDFNGEELRRHQADRPMLIYTLGWWMASRLSDNGKRPDELIKLLAEPRMLFTHYNRLMADAPDSLKIRE